MSEQRLNARTKTVDLHAKPEHRCPDWDYMLIRPGDPEMGCCLCVAEQFTGPNWEGE